jgi:hypothetical protein
MSSRRRGTEAMNRHVSQPRKHENTKKETRPVSWFRAFVAKKH